MLMSWLNRAHVRRWWGPPKVISAKDLADPRVARWIVSHEGTPFAYMQDYTVHGWEDHHFAPLPQGSRGIDQYIGEPDMIGIGHGPAFMAQRIKTLLETGAPALATDPHPDNTRAIAAYRKLGFAPTGPARQTKWGLILPMVLSSHAHP